MTSNLDPGMSTMNLRKGDGLTLRATVNGVELASPKRVLVAFAETDSAWITRADILSVEPRPLAVGDRVNIKMHRDSIRLGQIVAIDGPDAWVLTHDGVRSTFSITALERADD